MTFNERGWVYRGLYSPSPWATSTPAGMLETEVTFIGMRSRLDDAGGFEADAPEAYLTTWAHTEIETDTDAYVAAPGPPMRRRFVQIIMPIPDDPATYPVPGDTVRFTDALGRTVTHPIKKVDSPEGLADHLEIETERFE